MNILILGGNGYIGSKVTRALVNTGHSVICTKRATSNLTRVADIQDKIKWIPASIDSVRKVLQHEEVDYVINMACNYGRSNESCDELIEANFMFPLKVLNAMVEYGTQKFLTVGTGLPDELNMYSFSKKMFSEFGRFYVQKFGITFNSLKLEMFYGADEPKDRFLPSLIINMIDGKPISTTIGTQRRDIISSEDVTKAIMIIVNSDISGFHEIPVGTGNAPTISEIVDFIWTETGKKSELHKGAIPLRYNEPDCIADTSLLESIDEWNPVYWKQGIAKMIKKMKEN